MRYISTIILITGLLTIISIIFYHHTDEYKIITPYNGYSKTIFYTKSYVEKDGCIEFIDDWDEKRKICGTYEIEYY
jgi:hypothetical protein